MESTPRPDDLIRKLLEQLEVRAICLFFFSFVGVASLSLSLSLSLARARVTVAARKMASTGLRRENIQLFLSRAKLTSCKETGKKLEMKTGKQNVPGLSGAT